METIRTHYLDASALVKLLVYEDRSEIIRAYFARHVNFQTTSLCFAEALGVLKVKYHYRNLIDEETYLSACEELLAYARDGTIEIDEINISEREAFNKVESLCQAYSLDLSDCFQIYTLQAGFFSRFQGEAKPILITADSGLAIAAREEGLRAWCILDEDEP
ncbi:MAG: hypothetical protein RPU13_07640 [Candidatus Sedimenticola sp. (ex Thyasira tokunagai)]